MPAAELWDEARLAAAALLSCGALECEIIGQLARRRAPLSREHAVLLLASAARSSRFLTKKEEEKDCPRPTTTTTLTATTTATTATWIQLLRFADLLLRSSLLV